MNEKKSRKGSKARALAVIAVTGVALSTITPSFAWSDRGNCIITDDGAIGCLIDNYGYCSGDDSGTYCIS